MVIHYATATLLGSSSGRQPGPSAVRQQHCKYGPMIYFPHDIYIGGSLDKYGEYVGEETDFLLAATPEGGIVVEVGANIGCHTIPLAQKVGLSGHVVAFEPQRILHQMLCGSLAINGLWNASAEHIALGAKEGVIYVPQVAYEQDGNFGGIALTDGPGEPVSLRTLDSFALPALHLLKIDVEGMELDVLQGAETTIRKFRPLIYCENDRQEKSAALIAFLRSLDYDLYWHTPPLFREQNYRECTENIFGGTVSVNMACIPKERASQVQTNLQKVDV